MKTFVFGKRIKYKSTLLVFFALIGILSYQINVSGEPSAVVSPTIEVQGEVETLEEKAQLAAAEELGVDAPIDVAGPEVETQPGEKIPQAGASVTADALATEGQPEDVVSEEDVAVIEGTKKAGTQTEGEAPKAVIPVIADTPKIEPLLQAVTPTVSTPVVGGVPAGKITEAVAPPGEAKKEVVAAGVAAHEEVETPEEKALVAAAETADEEAPIEIASLEGGVPVPVAPAVVEAPVVDVQPEGAVPSSEPLIVAEAPIEETPQGVAVPEPVASPQGPTFATVVDTLIPPTIKFPILGELTVDKEIDVQTGSPMRYACRPSRESYELGVLSMTKPVVYWNGGKEFKFIVEKASFLGIPIKNFNIDSSFTPDIKSILQCLMHFELASPLNLSLSPVISMSLSTIDVDLADGKKGIEISVTVKLFNTISVKLLFSSTQNGPQITGVLGDLAVSSLFPDIKSLTVIPGLKNTTVTISNFQDASNLLAEVSGIATLFGKEIVLTVSAAREKAALQKGKRASRSRREKKPAESSTYLKVTAAFKNPMPFRPFEIVPLIDKVPMGGELKKIEINNVEFEFDAATRGVIVRGDATILGLTTQVEGEGGTAGFAFMAYPRDEWTLGTVVPFVKGTPLDQFKFENTALILSTLERHTMPNGIDVGAGMSVAADLELKGGGILDGLKLLLLNQVSKISFLATMGTSPDKFKLVGFVPIRLQMGEYLSLENIAIEIALLGPAFSVLGNLKFIPPPWAKIFPDSEGASKQKPLLFTARVRVQPDQASGAGTMQGDWVNPFGLKGLTISNTAVEIGINYPVFASTGLPSIFGLTGEMGIGKKKAMMALKVSANFSDLILMGRLNELSLRDLADLLNTMGIKIPADKVPNLALKKPEIAMAPKGGTIGEIVFESGFKLAGALEILGKSALVKIVVDKSGIIGRGSVSELNLGPLKITGAGPDGKYGTADDGPTIGVELTAAKQEVLVSGETSLWNSKGKIEIRMSLGGVYFNTQVKILDFFLVDLLGKSTDGADFEINGTFKQDFKQFIQESVWKRLQELRKEILNFRKAQEGVAKAREEVGKASKALDEARKKASGAVMGQIRAARSRVDSLQGELDSVKREIRACGGSANLIVGWGWFRRAVRRASQPFRQAAQAVAKTATTAGKGVATGAKAAGKGIETGAKAVGKGVATAAVVSAKFAEQAAREAANKAKLAYLYPKYAGIQTALVAARGVLSAAELAISGIDKIAEVAMVKSIKFAADTTLKGAEASLGVFDKSLGLLDTAFGAILDATLGAVTVKRVELTGRLSDLKSGKTPTIALDIEILGKRLPTVRVAFDPTRPADFAKNLVNSIFKR